MIYLHALRNFFGIWITPETKNKNCNLKWVHIVNIVALQLLVNLCTQNRLHISFDFKEDSLRSSRKSLCFVSFKRKCTFNWIPFHLVNVLARNVVLTQFPPFCDRIRGYGIWSIHPIVNRVRFVHNFYDTNTSIENSSWLPTISYRSRSAFRIGSRILIREFSIYRARTRAQVQNRLCIHNTHSTSSIIL